MKTHIRRHITRLYYNNIYIHIRVKNQKCGVRAGSIKRGGASRKERDELADVREMCEWGAGWGPRNWIDGEGGGRIWTLVDRSNRRRSWGGGGVGGGAGARGEGVVSARNKAEQQDRREEREEW